MILEATRTLTDWLAGTLKDASGVDQGVNAQLRAFATSGMLDSGDPMPELVRTVVDVTRDNFAARGEVDPNQQFPILVVSPDGPGEAEGQIRTLAKRDMRNVPFAIRYVTKNLTTAKGEADTWYTLRAVVKSLQVCLLDANEALRVRNGVAVMACTALRWGPAYAEVSGAAVTGGIVLDLALRDVKP